jgi:hypothetical protein
MVRETEVNLGKCNRKVNCDADEPFFYLPTRVSPAKPQAAQKTQVFG